MNKCVCEAACAGSDGKCYRGVQNQPVAAGFTLTNVYWPRYSMYFLGGASSAQLKTTSAYTWLNMGKDQFNLERLPGPGNHSRFLLGSAAFPQEVAYIGTTEAHAVNGHGLYTMELTVGEGLNRIAASVCWDTGRKAMMLGNEAGTHWAYIHRGSWLVFASSVERCKVGEAGLWTPTPAFTEQQVAMLPACC